MKLTKIREEKEIDQSPNIEPEETQPEIKAVVLKKHTWKTSLIFLLLSIPLFFYFSYGLKHLSQFETADEYRWIYDSESRIPQYWNAMLSHDWEKTYINDKPGVTTAIVSGLSLRYVNIENLSGRFVQQKEHSNIFNPEGSEIINFAFRLPLLVINGLLAVFWYFLLRRLFENNWTALLACSLILLSPILIGISQIVNPDTLLWSTSFTAIIAFLLFLKERKWYDAMLAGAFLGLALLSKYTTVIIVPYWFGLSIAYLIFQYDVFMADGSFRKRVIQIMGVFPLIFALGILIYVLLLPAALLNPEILLTGNKAFQSIIPFLKIIGYIIIGILLDAIILKSWVLKKLFFPLKYLWNVGSRAIFGGSLVISNLVLFNWAKNNFWGIPDIPFDAGNDKGFQALALIQKLFLEIKPLIFSLTPVVLALLAVTWVFYIIKKNPRNVFPIFALSVLPFVFYAAVINQGYLVHIRYSLMLYPAILTLSAIGIVEIVPHIRWRPLITGGIIAAVVIISIVEIKKIYPFYFNYTNDLLPKNEIITDAWGYGGYEAAQYIASQSDHLENLIIWSDYDGFCPFFHGLCIKDSDIKWVGYKTVNQISYYVLTARGSSKLSDTWGKMSANVDSEPTWRLDIGGRPDNFIEVFKVADNNYASSSWWRK